jgi:hypothetical protein
MKKKKNAIFNVIEYDWINRKINHYDVLPYFRNVWKNKTFNLSKKDVVDKETLKEWIIKASHYTFWARCEYECLIGPWPFGSKVMNEKLKELLTADFNFDDYKQNIDLCNVITTDMQKIDIHEQIMMNIDIIVEILSKEFKIE